MKSINENNVQKLKALLEKGVALPYKKVAKRFAKHAVDPNKSKNCFCNKSIRQGLVAFGDYLEAKKAVMPLKIDVIDFVLQNRNESGRTLQWYFGACMEFVLFCQKYYYGLFDGILIDTGVTRAVEITDESIILNDDVVFLNKEEA